MALFAAACGGSEHATSTDPTLGGTTATVDDTAASPQTTEVRLPATPSTTEIAQLASLDAVSGRTIAIDPGHNGKNGAHPAEINRQVDIGTKKKECDTTGTQTDQGYTESAYNLDVSLRLADILRSAGANVVMTRTDDNGWGPCIDERAAIGNRAGADVAISIHADGGPTAGRGFHVNYPTSIPGLTDRISEPSRILGLDIRDAFAAGTGMPYSTYLGQNAMVARDDLGGLNLSKTPKVLLETGNMRNATDVSLLSDPSFRQREAVAIANGLADYLSTH
jgi:N-acetylmuramoyl-L-alanine amidase